MTGKSFPAEEASKVEILQKIYHMADHSELVLLLTVLTDLKSKSHGSKRKEVVFLPELGS